jgi:hypothetical protein
MDCPYLPHLKRPKTQFARHAPLLRRTHRWATIITQRWRHAAVASCGIASVPPPPSAQFSAGHRERMHGDADSAANAQQPPPMDPAADGRPAADGDDAGGLPQYPGPGTRLGTCGFVSGRVDPLWPGISTEHRPVDRRLDGGATKIYSGLRETRKDVIDLDARLARLEVPTPARCALPPRDSIPWHRGLAPPAPAALPAAPRDEPLPVVATTRVAAAAAAPIKVSVPIHLPTPSTPISWKSSVVPSPETCAAVARWAEQQAAAKSEAASAE